MKQEVMQGMRGMFQDPTQISIEVAYTLIVIILCMYLFFKTKETFNLTKHKGIGYFRNTFLFFALAYLFRFIFLLFKLSHITFDFRIPKQMIGPASLIIIGYFSTMAILSLLMSTQWKKFNNYNIDNYMHIIAIAISVLVFITRSPFILTLTQLGLLIFTMIIVFSKKKKSGKSSHLRLIYLLLFLFWIVNLYILGPGHMLKKEIIVIFNLISTGIFALIIYKARKWIR